MPRKRKNPVGEYGVRYGVMSSNASDTYHRTLANAKQEAARRKKSGDSNIRIWNADTGVYTAYGSKKNPGVRMGLKSAIPAKFVTAKVRRVGNKVQILLNK